MRKIALVCAIISMSAVLTYAQTITVTSPIGGEDWTLGSTHPITWTSSGVTGNVRIVLYKRATAVGVIQDNVPAAQGSISWVVGSYRGGSAVPGSDYKIRVREMRAETMDSSDRTFTISPAAMMPPPPGSITVDSPNGGDVWWTGTAYWVRWTSRDVTGNVTIKLKKGAAVVKSASAANTGSALWMCSRIADGTDYRIRVESSDGGAFDESDRDFEVKTRFVSPPPDTPAPGTLPAISREAVVKLPPRLTYFAVNGGAEAAESGDVKFSYRCMGGGAPTQYRYRINEAWGAWQPVVPGREAYGSLLLFECVQNVFFQLKNEYGESNVLNDTIIDGSYRTERKIGVTQAMIWARAEGFTSSVLWQDCDDNCAWILPVIDGYSLELGFDSLSHKGNNLKGMKADYEVFGGGKLLKPGWEFVSFELTEFASVGNPDVPEAFGGRVKLMPAVGGRDIKLQVHLWRNFLAPRIDFLVKSITLRGPCQEHISKAFDQE
jgi:hypothetical protein